MKKLIISLLIFGLSIALVGCNNDKQIVDLIFDERMDGNRINGTMTINELEAVNLFIDSLRIPNDLIQFYALSNISKINDDSFPYDSFPGETNQYFISNIGSICLNDEMYAEYNETLYFQMELEEMEVTELYNQQKQYLLIDKIEHMIYKTRSNNFTYEMDTSVGTKIYAIDLKAKTINQVSKNGSEFQSYIEDRLNTNSPNYIAGFDSANYVKVDLHRNYQNNEISMLFRSVEDQSSLETSYLFGRVVLKYITEDLHLELEVGASILVGEEGLTLKSMGYILKYEFNNNNTFEKIEIRKSFDQLITHDEFVDEILSIFNNINEKYFIRNAISCITSEIYEEYLMYTWNYSFD